VSRVEFRGGPVTHSYLMNKSKYDLARMYMELLDVLERERADPERYRSSVPPRVRESF